ncbi:transposable element Tcb1 transposase [Trichonephila clavipes]|uniref:Transposable element Tcb1 transposase n=1 Tax=Trichonephila clavipes TaxID=2585209 RepID=A0A8X6R8A2_TRICX|nr:transposable element Tcb1 transposase [Trichonephila clavipes]
MTPELAPPLPNYHTTPTARLLSMDRFHVHLIASNFNIVKVNTLREITTKVMSHRKQQSAFDLVSQFDRDEGGYDGPDHIHLSAPLHDNARPHVARIVQRFFVNHQFELLPWPARSPYLSPKENMWSVVTQRLIQITPPAATPDQLLQRVEVAWSAVPQEPI